MKCFGMDSPAVPRVDVPVGQECASCHNLIMDGDVGFIIPHVGEGEPYHRPWHRECLKKALGLSD